MSKRRPKPNKQPRRRRTPGQDAARRIREFEMTGADELAEIQRRNRERRAEGDE